MKILDFIFFLIKSVVIGAIILLALTIIMPENVTNAFEVIKGLFLGQ